jgi:hypothetical protein
MLPKPAARPDWQIALAVAAGLRVFYSAMAAVFFPFLHPDPRLIQSNGELTANLPAPHGLQYALLGIWQRFDTLWYLRIAEHGYDRPAAVIFYPLYPAAIRLISGLMPTIAAALLVSTVAAFFFFWGFLRLAGDELSQAGKSRTVLLFCVWPTSFMLFAGYAESLTMALVVWAIVFGRAARWELATACGLFAGLARPSGVLIFVPLAVMALRSRQARSLIVALTPAGLIGYWGWLRWSGQVSVVESYRMYWSTEVTAPWTTLWRVIGSLTKHFDPLLTISVVALILFFITGVMARRRLEDRCFSAAAITHLLLRACSPPMVGTPRYLLAVYPAYLTMGEWAEKMERRRFAFFCSALFVFNMVWMWAFLSWSLVL